MDVPSIVRAFNSLPRPEHVGPYRLENHWQFAIHHVPLPPSGDIVNIVHLTSRFRLSAGPAQILCHSSATAQAEVVLPLLLKAFIEGARGMNEEPVGPPMAPWRWGTKDPEFATALGEKLRSAGVREELCTVHVADKEVNDIEQETWSEFVGTLMKVMGQGANSKRAPHTSEVPAVGAEAVCAECKKSSSQTLSLCGGCKNVRYCSRACQVAAWKTHKKICKLGPLEYYNTVAPNSPEAQTLAARIRLALPRPNGPPLGIAGPIRRLVVTGLDTRENIVTLVGPNEKEMVDDTHKQSRIEVLLRPPPGTPMFKFIANQNLDENCPPWTPREPSADEQEHLRKVRDMQQRIRRHMRSRPMSSISGEDMKVIVMEGFGRNWSQMMPIYQDAINSLDHGT